MGNRAVVTFVENNDCEGIRPAVYLHWGGSCVRTWLQELQEVMRTRSGDAEYAAARFTQLAGNHIEGNLSLGLTTVDVSAPGDASPGDAGVFVVNVSSWTVANLGGSACKGAFSGKVSE